MPSFYPTFSPEQLETETWKPLIGFESHYEISNIGRVKRIKPQFGATVGRILKWKLSHDGYPQVYISINGRTQTLKVHTLVMLTFTGPRPPKMHINHIDGNKMNAAVGNLEFCTAKQNQVHASKHGLLATGERSGSRLHIATRPRGDNHYSRQHPEKLARGERNANSKLTAEQVREIRQHKLSIRLMALKYGVSRENIKRVLNRRIWAHV
jgi:hypothetical protein